MCSDLQTFACGCEMWSEDDAGEIHLRPCSLEHERLMLADAARVVPHLPIEERFDR